MGTLQHRSQYPVAATHPTLTKSTKPFILAYTVIVIVLLSSVPGKAYLSICSITLLASPKLEARALIEELLKEYNRGKKLQGGVVVANANS